MKNRITSAGAAADSEQKAEVPMSSPNNAKPDVVRRFISLSIQQCL